MKTVDKIRTNRETNLVDVSEQKQIVENEIRERHTPNTKPVMDYKYGGNHIYHRQMKNWP
jgi:hypothetical protein